MHATPSVTIDRIYLCGVNRNVHYNFQQIRPCALSAYCVRVTGLSFPLGDQFYTGGTIANDVYDLIFTGQFIHQRAKYVRSSLNMKNSPGDDSVKLISRLTFSGPHVAHRTVRAIMARRRDMAANQHRPCWHVTRNGVGLIRGRVDDYVVPHLLVNQSSFSLLRNISAHLYA